MFCLSIIECRIASSTASKGLTSMLLAALLLLSPSAVVGQDDAEVSQSAAPLFATHSMLDVTIEAPLTTLMRERPQEEYLDGKFSFAGNDGSEQTLDLKVRTRGKYRRAEEHCDFSLIRLNFRKKQVAGTKLAGQDKLKLITHCQNNKPRYEQVVLREFLAYRILQVMTNKSYSVRLLRIHYIDTEGAKPMTRLGFVVEDDDDVAARVGMQLVKTGDITIADIDRRQRNLVNVFQYLIGNTDFSLIRAEPDEACCHNSDLMSATGEPPFTPLPYDFDFAGLVNAPYAQPNPRFTIRSVRTRLYRGLCDGNELLPETLQNFHDKKDAIYAIVDELNMLTRRHQRDVTRYLDSFYELISRSKKVDAKIIRKCNDEV